MEVSNSDVQKRTCLTHGEYEQSFVEILGRKIYKNCPKCIAEQSKKEDSLKTKLIEERRLREIERCREKSLIPKRFKSCSFENFKISNDGQAAALKSAMEFVSDWEEVEKSGRCLIFSGKVGTGKTHLACAIANNLVELSVLSKLYTVAGLMRYVKESFSSDSQESESMIIDELSNLDLLLLDEAGMDYGTDFNKATLFEILNRRYENMKPTILMTNLDINALREYLGDRLLDRMREGGGKLVSFTWESQRR